MKRKTLSLSKVTLPALFRAVADILEEDTPLAESLRLELLKRIETSHKKYSEVDNFFDKNVSSENMRAQLDELSVPELFSIVNRFSLDSSHALRKTSDKQKILNLIIDGRGKLLNRYSGFEPKESANNQFDAQGSSKKIA